jgi:hypothetical protein
MARVVRGSCQIPEGRVSGRLRVDPHLFVTGRFRPQRRYCGISEERDSVNNNPEGRNMLGTILLVVLILMLIGAVPSWPHSRNWGYGPSGGLGLVVIIIIVLLLMGRL